MAVMNEVIDSRSFSNFCGVNSPDEVPNGDTIGIHTVKATAANEHDVTVMSEMLHGEEERA